MAAVARPPVRMRPASEFGIHHIHFHLDRDLDGTLPVLARSLALGLVVGGPTIHRQQRGDADAGILQRAFERFDPIGEYTRRLEPFKEVPARREFDPVVPKFLYLERES